MCMQSIRRFKYVIEIDSCDGFSGLFLPGAWKFFIFTFMQVE